jgi:hypothetical protein
MGMLVCTGISNSAYQNPVSFSSDVDYILLVDSENVLSRGVYKKNGDGKWEF